METVAQKELGHTPLHKIRESGIELFRIISMWLIVAHHYVVNSGVTDLAFQNPLSAQSLFLFLFGGWGKMGINCFVLITGYFMCSSHITTKKFVKLLGELMFYRVIIYTIFLLTGYQTFTLKNFVVMILPFIEISNNFTGCFLMFYLCIPFLNILVKNMNERQHIYLLIILLFIYTILGTLPKFNVTMNYVSWFCVLYFIASYIRLYPKKIFESKRIWGFAALMSFIISAISIVACAWLGEKINQNMAFYFVSDSNKVLAVTTALCGFMFFKNLKFKSKFINTVAASTFGVLLIHANSTAMRQWLWKDVVNVIGAYGSSWLIIHAVLSVCIIYIVCTVIDFIRLRFIEAPLMKKFDNHFKAIDEYIQGKNKKEQE